MILHDPFYGVVEAADGEFVVGFLDGDDDVQLAGALVDHADVDVRVGDHAEDARGGAFGVDHALADDGDEGESVFDADVVGLLSGMNAYLIIIFLGNNNKSGKYELNVFTALTIS